MEALRKTHIGFRTSGGYHRFKVEHLILYHSNGKLTCFYVYRPHLDIKVEMLVKAKKLENIHEYLDENFFDIRDGWIFNLNYYWGHTIDREIVSTLETKAELLPSMIVARSRKAAFNKALEQL